MSLCSQNWRQGRLLFTGLCLSATLEEYEEYGRKLQRVRMQPQHTGKFGEFAHFMIVMTTFPLIDQSITA